MEEKEQEQQKEKNTINEKKEKIKKWFGNRWNIILVCIILFALVIRIYFFMQTSQQTFWWDEAEYGSMGKNLAYGIPYEWNPQRPFLFPGILSLFYMMQISDAVIKFLIVLLPSAGLVFCVYFLGKEMYGKRIGIIAAFMISASWTLVFWTNRLQPDFISMCFQTLAIGFMWRYWKQSSRRDAIYAGAFASLGFQFKVSGMLIPIAIALFILIKDRVAAFKNKDYWIFALAFIIFFIPQLISSYFIFNNPLSIFGTNYVSAVGDVRPISWDNLEFLYLFTNNVLFVLFLIGATLALKFVLYLDVMIKDKKKMLDPDFFSVMLIILVSLFYTFYIKAAEDRWLFIWLPFLFFFIGKACIFLYEQGKKYNKAIVVAIIVALLAYGAYAQLQQANMIIKDRKDSYSQVKEAALWMKENSQPGDIIATGSVVQTYYYAEREVITFYDFKGFRYREPDEFEAYLLEKKPKYLVISGFEPAVPKWTYNFTSRNASRYVPVMAWFEDAEKQNPLLIIYEIRY